MVHSQCKTTANRQLPATRSLKNHSLSLYSITSKIATTKITTTTSRNQIGVDKIAAVSEFRQVTQRKGGLARAVRSGNDSANKWRRFIHHVRCQGHRIIILAETGSWHGSTSSRLGKAAGTRRAQHPDSRSASSAGNQRISGSRIDLFPLITL